MGTSIDIDERLVRRVMKIAGVDTKKEAVHRALQEITRLEELREAARKVHGIGWEGDLDAIRRGRLF